MDAATSHLQRIHFRTWYLDGSESLTLRQSADEFVRRMEGVLDDLHLAINEADFGAQQSAFAALVGLLEMLKSEVRHGDDDGNDAA